MVKRFSPLFAEAIVNSVRIILLKCIELNLKCTDPPIVITPLLRCLGYNEYQIRKFWSFFENLEGNIGFEIYHYSSAHFSLSLSYRKKTIMHLEESCIPLDELDCQELRSQCIKTPHSHALYVYIEGKIGNSSIRLNIVKVLYLLYLRNPKLTDELIETLINIIWKRASIRELYDKVLEVLKVGNDILQFILPSIPITSRDLLKLSPILRKIASFK